MLVVTHDELYHSKKSKNIDWIEWCWQNIGQDNFDWTIDISSRTDTHRFVPPQYIYYIRFKNEGDKVLFILNWL